MKNLLQKERKQIHYDIRYLLLLSFLIKTSTLLGGIISYLSIFNLFTLLLPLKELPRLKSISKIEKKRLYSTRNLFYSPFS